DPAGAVDAEVGVGAGGDGGRVDAVPGGDQQAELVEAHRVGAGRVQDAGVVMVEQFDEDGGEIGDRDRAADLVGEEHARPRAGGQVQDQTVVAGIVVADDDRGTHQRGTRVDGAHRGL